MVMAVEKKKNVGQEYEFAGIMIHDEAVFL